MSIDLFGRSGGVWDDTELVRAYDAAMDEFHVHHPGPGSWLDKATAALAKGQPLPDAGTYGSGWYEMSMEDKSKLPIPPSTKPKKRKRDAVASSAPNPYKTQTIPRAESPSWTPPSPPQSVVEETDAGITPADTDAWPQMSPDTASGVSSEQALSLAMSAQYMAGYWMGVLHSRQAQERRAEEGGAEDEGEQKSASREAQPAPIAADEPVPTNIIKTRQQFDGARKIRR